MRKRLPGKLFSILCFFTANTALGQYSYSDSSNIKPPLRPVIRLHNEIIGGNSHLFNGPEHKGYMRPAKSHPYFLDEDIHIGNVVYDGILYRNVPLMYDIQHDNAITLQYVKDSSIAYRSFFKIDLIPERTGNFNWPGHEFVKIEADSANKMKTGFYEVLYNGNLKVLVKRTKLYAEEIRSNMLERRFDSTNAFYIQKEGIYHPVKNKKAALGILKEKKRELSSYISKNRRKFRKKPEALLVGIATLYDQLTK